MQLINEDVNHLPLFCHLRTVATLSSRVGLNERKFQLLSTDRFCFEVLANPSSPTPQTHSPPPVILQAFPQLSEFKSMVSIQEHLSYNLLFADQLRHHMEGLSMIFRERIQPEAVVEKDKIINIHLLFHGAVRH